MLALLLQRAGIESVILENRDREYVERRVRAGLLEQNTVDLMHELGVGERLAREGLEHDGIYLRRAGQHAAHRDRQADRPPRDDLRPAGGGQGPDRGAAAARRRPAFRGRRTSAVADLESDRPRDRVLEPAAPSTSSSATSSPAATASTGSAGRRSRASCAPSTSTSIRSAGWGSWPRPRRPPTS